MRVLLDENLPRKLKHGIAADATTVPERGWAGTKNGALLKLAAANFDVMLTMDRGIEFQNSLQGLDLCVLVISAPSNEIDTLIPLLPEINDAISSAEPGRILRVGGSDPA